MISEKTKPEGPSDVYSYAMIYWFLQTQQIPFEGRNGFLVLGEIVGQKVSCLDPEGREGLDLP